MSGSPAKDEGGGADVFLLERLFPEPHEAFNASSIPDPKSDCIVALDTNALLLPYSVIKAELNNLRSVYSRIANDGRLFIPERVAREFIRNRDRKLAEMLQTINNLKSKINISETSIAPFMKGLAEYDSLASASCNLAAARKAYATALDGLSTQIRSWHGNDPVTSLYADLLKNLRLASPGKASLELELDWIDRLKNKIPPGYKDKAKDDLGIGDFIIWMSLVNLGAQHKRDLIFVTGEEKADWFVRSGGEAVYPRPELVDEYRRASGGRTLRLVSLHELLREMDAPDRLVDDVQSAEDTANAAIMTASVSPIVAVENHELQTPPVPPAFPAQASLWPMPPCPASPDGLHDIQALYPMRSRYGGLTYQGFCSRCRQKVDTGEPWD